MWQSSVKMIETESEMIVNMIEDQQLMQSLKDAKYDLILTDPAMFGGIILGHYLNLPIVYNVCWTVYSEAHFVIAPSPLSYVPFPALELSDRMSFLERVKNVVVYTITEILVALLIMPINNELCEQFIGPGTSYFSLTQSADLWLHRVDFIFEFPHPTMPNIVYMGGFQCKPSKPLPQDLEENMQRRSRLHKDVPGKPLDNAIFWTEFVMRHKGAAHLHTESYKMPWYSYHSVDVILFLLSSVSLKIMTIYAVIRYFCCRICMRKTKNKLE